MNVNLPKKAVFLAGGKGTRLYPITKEIPKPLLPIRKKPIINYQVDFFASFGIREIAVLISKDFQKDFEEWLEKNYNSRKKDIKLIGEPEPLGTFGGLGYLKDWLGKENFFLINVDDLSQINLSQMADFHFQSGALGTIALVEVGQDIKDFGAVVCNSDFIEDFREKSENPPSNYVNAGWYLLSSDIFNYHPGLKFSMIEKDIFPKLAKERKLVGFKYKGKWIDCGTWERYEKALSDWES